MRNVDGKRQSKRVNFDWKSVPLMVCNYLKLLAIPTGFEPVTIGLEGLRHLNEFNAVTVENGRLDRL